MPPRLTKLDKIINDAYANWPIRFINEKRYIFRMHEKLGFSIEDPRHWGPDTMRRFKAKVRPRLIAVLHGDGRIEYH